MSSLALVLLAATASAHEPGLSRATLEADRITVVAASADIDHPEALLDGTTVDVAAGACTLGTSNTRTVERDGIEVSASVTCPGSGERTLTAGWLTTMAPGHRAVVEDASGPIAVLDASNPSASVAAVNPGALSVAASFVVLGFEHIVTGWDHLVFLAALLLIARSLREATGIVSGFTVAHSVTLSMAALGVVAPPSWIVEPAIAATILWVGIENLFDPPASRRFIATLLLGLIHGFGFAGLLAELGMPAGQTLTALLAFNAGVEIGQIAIVVCALPPLLWAAHRPEWRTRVVPVLSVAIALMGLFWLVERLATA